MSHKHALLASKGAPGVDMPLYKSDAKMSEDEIIQGFMEIADLPDEPHKYYRHA
jgi:hypothetical protein